MKGGGNAPLKLSATRHKAKRRSINEPREKGAAVDGVALLKLSCGLPSN